LHRAPEASDFDELRQRGELASLIASEAGSAYLAQGYTGWPHT
jgi:p-hydroxybenzoate 3-monooxygenase